MLKVVKADLFSLNADILINPVNCYGVMGKGIALEFKKRWPAMYERYRIPCLTACTRPTPGDIIPWENPNPTPYYILNVATKDHWRDKSQYRWVGRGLFNLSKWLEENGLQGLTVAMPLLGCGEGGLDPVIVQRMIESHFAISQEENVILCLPPQ
jgi:O-acetyl-ADP-ribose deacetylase (regulator of RNase III)